MEERSGVLEEVKEVMNVSRVWMREQEGMEVVDECYRSMGG